VGPKADLDAVAIVVTIIEPGPSGSEVERGICRNGMKYDEGSALWLRL